MEFGGIIKKHRLQGGLTQVQLAHRSGISLPAIQKIEAGGANPSVATLDALFKVLGLRLNCENEATDWGLLARFGMPLMTAKKSEVKAPGDPLQNFIRALHQACHDIHTGTATEREREAVQGTLLAVHDHYPSFFRAHFKGAQDVKLLLPSKISPRLIKLRRQALAGLAQHL